MIFRSRNKKLDASDEIFISGCKTEQAQTTKFLGVIIDCNLTWKYHVNYVCSKISKNIGILIKSHKIFNMDTLLTLCYSFIYPYLNHCVHLWGSTYASYINKVFLLQKKAVRIIHGVNRRAHSEPLFSSLLSFPLVKCMCIILVLWCIIITMVYCRIYLICLNKNSNIHQYNTRQSNLLHVPCCRTELGKRSFRYKAVTIWNVIFENISVDIEIGTFKRHLKSYILSNSIETIQ